MLPGVYEKIKDGGLGIVPYSNAGLFAIVGPAYGGEANKIYRITDPATAKDIFKMGMLVEHIEDSFGSGAAVLIALKTELDVPATISSVNHTGDGAASANVGGTPQNTRTFILKITKGGSFDTAKYQLSKNGGITWTTELRFKVTSDGPPRKSKIDLGNGAWIEFTEADPPESSFTAGDTYEFTTNEAVSSTEKVLDGVKQILESEPEVRFVYVVPPSDSAFWASLHALAEENFNNKHTPIFFLCNAVLDSEDPDTFTQNRVSELNNFSSVWMAVNATWGVVADEYSGVARRPAGGCIAGLISKMKPQHSIGWVRYATLPKVIDVLPKLNNGHLEALEDAGYIALRLWPGYGFAPVSGRTTAPATSDYKWLENRRIINEAVRGVRTAAIPFVNAPGDEAGLVAYQKALEAPLEAMKADGAIVSYKLVIPEGQDIWATGQVKAKLTIVPVPTMRELHIEFGLGKPEE